MTQHKTHDAARRWSVFAAVATALFAAIWLGWSQLSHQDILPGIGPLQTNTTVAVGLRQAPGSLDIRTQEGHAIDQALLGNVYETLIQRDQSNNLKPGLARSWKVSKDALTYTFTLHSALRFSNGHDLDASDVVWSLQQSIRKHYVGWQSLGSLSSVRNPDSSTVVIILSKPNPTLLRALAWRPGIVYDSQAPIDYANQAIGSGPFIVSGYDAGRSITLRRNDSYWSDPAASSQVTLRYYADDASLARALRDSSVSMAIPTGPKIEELVAEDPTLKVVDGMSTQKVLLAYKGSTDSIFSDLHVRQATRYMLDTTALMRTQGDAAQQLGGPISPLEPGYEDLTGLFPHDEAKARSMFAYFGPRYLGEVPFTFLVPQRDQALGEAISQELHNKINFTVHMQVVDDATLQARMAKGDYTVALLTMDGTAIDGTDDAEYFADTKSPLRYENGAAQQQYAKAMAATNDDDYREGMKAYARIVSQDAASDWLYTRKSRVIVKTKLAGYPRNMVDQLLPLKDLLPR